MCRLFGYVAASPTALVDELGPDDFQAFTALTKVHADGWGMAWHDADDGHTKSARSSECAAHDPQYARLAARPLGTAGFVHLRWATGGLTVSEENTHPFVDGDLAFAHNGHVAPIERLESLLDADSLTAVRGTTDSERYFRLIVQCIREAEGDEAAGVTAALRLLMRDFPHASLNSLLLTRTKLFAIHVNSSAPPPVFDALEGLEELPPRHEREYYAMDYRSTSSGSLQVISSGLAQQHWTPVPVDTAVMFDLESRQLRRLDLVPDGA